MIFSPTVVLLDAFSMVESTNATPFRLENYSQVGLQAVYTGSPVGTLKLQYSLDQGSDGQGTGVSNWSDVAGSSVAVSAAGDTFWEVTTATKWVRVVYTFTSGTGSLTVRGFAKGSR